ncbi:unnamed protein product [Onchocerca flexuosa]|uniref:CNNM transmembrane domain-containing protein n=1 Tax=Onchocerca flexuosa TaxID=387005 RepID=A0A183H4Y3_9BILA|nr:unnamed protein product [Onchocerca flexuosa]
MHLLLFPLSVLDFERNREDFKTLKTREDRCWGILGICSRENLIALSLHVASSFITCNVTTNAVGLLLFKLCDNVEGQPPSASLPTNEQLH